MAGQLFKYHEQFFCPQQDCERVYGGSVDINQVIRTENGFSFIHAKKLCSPHPKLKEAFHTLNEYKGFVVIDVQGFDYPFVIKAIRRFSQSLHNCSCTLRKYSKTFTKSK